MVPSLAVIVNHVVGIFNLALPTKSWLRELHLDGVELRH